VLKLFEKDMRPVALFASLAVFFGKRLPRPGPFQQEGGFVGKDGLGKRLPKNDAKLTGNSR